MTLGRNECIDRFRQALAAFGEPPGGQWEEFAALFRRRDLAKGDHFVRAGSRPTTLAFVVAGLLRIYYTRSDGKEFNKSFVFFPDFVAAFEALLAHEQSTLSIQTLEPTTLLVADHASVVGFYEKSMYWQRLGRILVEKLYAKKVRKEAAFLLSSAAERYATFLADYRDVDNRIPDYHVASYLGITPEALSRIRKRRLGR